MFVLHKRRKMTDENTDELKVFISHSNEPDDYNLVTNEVVTKLESNNRAKIKIYGQDQFTPGARVVETITKTIENVDRTLLFLSKNALESPWCSFELLISLERSQRANLLSVVLLLYDLDESELPHIPVLQAARKIHFQKGQDDWVNETVEALKEHKSITHDVLPAGNVAHGLVWSHYAGYLQYVLPELKEALENSEWYKSQSKEVQSRVSWKLYEMVPESCTCKFDLPKEDNNIQEVAVILKKKVQRSGNERTILVKLYSVTDGTQTFYCMCEYPPVIGTMKAMEDNHLATFSHKYPASPGGDQKVPFTTQDKRLQLGRFFYTMNSVVNHFRESTDRAKVVLFKDENENKRKLSEVLIEAIKEDVQQKEAAILRPKVENLEPIENEFSYKYEVYVASSEEREDEDKAHQITEYLKKSGINNILENDVEMVGKQFTDKLQTAVKECRWFVILMTKNAMHNEKLNFNALAALSDSIYKRKVRVIPVVERSEDLYIPEALRWVTYIPLDEQPATEDYVPKHLVSLHSIISGQDVPMETQMVLPAGDVAYGLAWGYVANYLNKIIPEVLKGILPAFEEEKVSSFKCPQKLFIVIPKSCHAPEELKDTKHSVGRMSNFRKTADVFPFGPHRPFSCNIYKVGAKASSVKSGLYFVGQYAASVTCLDEMRGWGIAGVNQDTMSKEARRFYEIVRRIMEQAVPEKAESCEFVFFDDENESLADIMEKKIEEVEVQHAAG